MFLTKHQTAAGPRWALDGYLLPATFSLSLLMELPNSAVAKFLQSIAVGEKTDSPVVAPIEATQEVWACGVTYLRSRDARKEESSVKDVYQKVYEAERPEIFFKANGWRVMGHGMPIRIRADSTWNVPEPEMTLVVNAHGEIIGYCAGNDVSSRDIEGENPLYLPQAKVYNGACALGPGIQLCDAAELHSLSIAMQISRGVDEVRGVAMDASVGKASSSFIFSGETSTTQMKRKPEELVRYLYQELSFPNGAFVLTGTGIVPGSDFSLKPGDVVQITVGEMTLENVVE
jgi:2-dehydro-3-deoxy-D-arabinonate dehydratase